jgi:lipoprotein signal peptidase
VIHRRARVYDALAFMTAILVLVLDQWTKAWVVINLSPSFFGPCSLTHGIQVTTFYQ